MAIVGPSLPEIPWRTMSGEFVLTTPTLVGQVFAATMGSDMAIYNAAEVHRVAMLAAFDPAVYDISTGWPAMYGE